MLHVSFFSISHHITGERNGLFKKNNQFLTYLSKTGYLQFSTLRMSVCPFTLRAETVLSTSVGTTTEMKRLGRCSRLIPAIWTRLGVLGQNRMSIDCILFNKQEKCYEHLKLPVHVTMVDCRKSGRHL